MQRLIALKDRFDIAAACDTDHDRHGVVTRGAGLVPANHYLAAMIAYLFRHRPRWPAGAGVGKTIVCSSVIDRLAAQLARPLFDAPVGFKWFAPALLDGSLGFAGEESAGASLLRSDGRVWTTDKDGIVPALLAAEITGRLGKDPAALHEDTTRELGVSYSERLEAPATPEQKKKLAQLKAQELRTDTLAGEKITAVLDRAPANNAPIGGIKVVTAGGWFAARPSGTESLYKVYAESFRSEEHLRRLLADATAFVDAAIK